MMPLSITVQAVRRRRVGLVWWSLGMAATTALIAIAYPAVRDNSSLDRTFASLPPSIQTALGLSPGTLLTSPVGYLNSQFFANVFPIVLLVFALGSAAWTVGGDESAGTLELLLANPVSRTSVAVLRYLALVLMLGLLSSVSLITLLILAPVTGLAATLATGNLIAVTVACMLMALCSASIAFAVGAATGDRGRAVGVASAIAVAGYIVQGLAEQVTGLRGLRAVSPWHWLLGPDPLQSGWSFEACLLPLVVSLALMVVGVTGFRGRDLR